LLENDARHEKVGAVDKRVAGCSWVREKKSDGAALAQRQKREGLKPRWGTRREEGGGAMGELGCSRGKKRLAKEDAAKKCDRRGWVGKSHRKAKQAAFVLQADE